MLPPIGDFQNLSEEVTKSFLSVTEFHGHELSILVKMCAAGKMIFKISLKID